MTPSCLSRRKAVPSVEPHHAKTKLALDPHIKSRQEDHRDNHLLFTFPGAAPGSPPARPPVSSGRSRTEPTPLNTLFQAHPSLVAPAVPNTHKCVGNAQDETLSNSSAPPPVPPKHPMHDRPKTLSTFVPTDISPARRVCSHSPTDAGHSCLSSIDPAPASSENAPAVPNQLTSQQSAARISVVDTLSFSSDAPRATPSSMDPVTFNPSSAPAPRNRLHKPPPHPSLHSNSSHSVLSLLLSRAFGSGESLPRHSRSNSAPSMGDRSYRPTRSFSDGNSKAPYARPSPSSRSSDTAESSCTASSSGSTSLSYASTTLTTPDSTSSPSLSPRNSTRANKLQKKRPSLAPSAYLYPPSAHAVALGRSKSTPNSLGQRSPRNRIWSSVEEARYAAEEVDPSGDQEPPLWYPSPADVSESPSTRSTLGPIFEVRRRPSSQALSELACIGLCSTSDASPSSQLASNSHPMEPSHVPHDHAWQSQHAELFNPYIECASPIDVAAPLSADYPSNNPAFAALDAPLPDSQSKEKGSSGFAVVHGYLDRSEDAMRRWTLAMADVPDEILVQHLERLRKESMALARGRLPGRRSAAPSQIGHGDEEPTLDSRSRRSSFFFGGPREMGISPRSPSHAPSHARFSVGHYDRELDGDDSDEEALSDEEDDEEDWKTARQVLFRCRELVQTERSYQARLRELASTELSHRYATLVARYIPALLNVSETLLAHLLDDPSAWGVSAAFFGCEEELEAAFVAWSGVVGEFFTEDANLRPSRKLTRKLADEVLSIHGHDGPSSRLLRTRSQVGLATSHRHSKSRRYSSTVSDIGHGETYSNIGHGDSAGMFTAALGTGLALGLGSPASTQSPHPSDALPSSKSPRPRSLYGQAGLRRVSTISSGINLSWAVTSWKRKSMSSSLTHVPGLSMTSPTPSIVPAKSPTSPSTQASGYRHGHHHSTSSAHGHGTPKKATEHDMKMTVRDLAIQPTQRVMRYVMQYHDLLDHTPAASPSRALVERAYESALRIAQKCDRAQAHVMFPHQAAQNSSTHAKNDKHASRLATTV